MQSLPIDAHIPSILELLQKHCNLVLLAPPGTGKTTRVPPALAKVLKGEVIVLQPRRVAARLSAERVAKEAGEKVGEWVGYQFRFENKTSAKTQIRFMTEGTFTRRLLNDQRLSGVAAVVLDEFHERHLHTDFALSALRALQQSARPDLKILVMSATIDPKPISEFLSNCPIHRVETPIYPIEYFYEAESPRALQNAVATLLKEPAGGQLTDSRSDILVFLPGQREIENAARDLSHLSNVQVIPFYSSASEADQRRALTPEGPRKIILSTNIAETSLTIEGVRAVIDSGLAKVPRFSYWSGLPQLKLQKISKASSIQRAGRAGRTGPGKCIRLYARQDFDARPAFDEPEISRSDLSSTLLELLLMDLKNFKWFEEPPTGLLDSARGLLVLLHATREGGITELGKRLASLPLPPRLARLVLYGEEKGIASSAVSCAAVLSVGFFEEDLLESVRRLPSKLPRALYQAREQIASAMRVSKGEEASSDELLARCVLQAFPDRVGKVSDKKELVLNLCGGGSVVMRDRALLESATFFVLPEIEEMVTPRGKKLVARCAVGIEPEWLFDFDVREESQVRWNSGRRAVEEVSSVKYGELVLSETVQVPTDKALAARMLLENWQKSNGISKILGGEEVESLLSRLSFLKSVKNPPAFVSDLKIDKWLESYVMDSFTQFAFKEFSEHNLKDYLMFGMKDAATGENIRKLIDSVPEFVLIGQRKVRVNYSENQAPWIESRIQDFFGMREGPKVLGQNLTLHLLAPNKRAVQVTQDLAGFWTREYPKLRIELGRRYPRHKWPEKPV